LNQKVTSMTLTQLECPLDPNVSESLASFLEEDALSTSWYERSPEEWVFQVIVEPTKLFHVEQLIGQFFEGSPPPLNVQPVPKEDWVAAVYRDFPPLTIGRFYVYGSHVESDPGYLIPLHVDAATAFGSGQHESTEGCLKALSDLLHLFLDILPHILLLFPEKIFPANVPAARVASAAFLHSDAAARHVSTFN